MLGKTNGRLWKRPIMDPKRRSLGVRMKSGQGRKEKGREQVLRRFDPLQISSVAEQNFFYAFFLRSYLPPGPTIGSTNRLLLLRRSLSRCYSTIISRRIIFLNYLNLLLLRLNLRGSSQEPEDDDARSNDNKYN